MFYGKMSDMDQKKNSLDGACPWKKLSSLASGLFHSTNGLGNTFGPRLDIPEYMG
jgi:hypothetical protein